MSAAFDTLKFVEKLEAGGFSPSQARAAAGAFSDATGEQLATKADITAVRSELREGLLKVENNLRAEIAPLKAEQLVIKWTLGFNLAVTAAVLFLLVKH